LRTDQRIRGPAAAHAASRVRSRDGGSPDGSLLRTVREIGENYDPTYARILKINADYDESVGFAFTFWDNWVDASNHEWQYHEPIREHDWPRFAREIAQAVRRGEFPPDEFLLGQIRRKPRRSLGQWLKSLFGARRSTSGCS
jgi:hypothetical protein